MDLNERQGVLGVMIDFSKAFNRIDHNIIVTKLAEMGVPNWLLRILMGFLSNRKLQVKYRGGKSMLKDMPGSGPQGTVLGMFLFIILINPIGFKPPTSIGNHMVQPINKRKPLNNLHLKYIDDMTIAESISLKSKLKFSDDMLNPRTCYERTGHMLEPNDSILNTKLKDINKYARNKVSEFDTDILLQR